MRIRSCVIAIAALLIPGVASATPACDAVRQLVIAADTHFEGLIARQRYRDIYEGSLIVPGFTECEMSRDDYPNGLTNYPPGHAVDYGCVVRFEVPVPATELKNSLIADMEQCLGVAPAHDRGGSAFVLSEIPDYRQVRVSMYESGSTQYAVRIALWRYEANGGQ